MIKLGVIYGGMSTERGISCKSAKAVIYNLSKEKYEIYPIFIDENGDWFEVNNDNKKEIENIIKYLRNLDIVFPVLHGLYGEDGTIQGMLELLKVKYVGCKVLASSIGMDKVYSKLIFEKAKISQAEFLYIRKCKDSFIFIDNNLSEKNVSLDEIANATEEKLGFPVFIKPSNSGSSFGVNKAVNKEELKEYIRVATKYDDKVLVEEAIVGKEVECAVLGNLNYGIQVTEPGEIIPAEEFYSFDAKYNNVESKTLIPANITAEQKEEVKNMARKAFCAIDGSGLARIDFFVQDKTGKVIINEINTMPGFTSISMYPKLFENFGYSYSELLDKIIEVEM